MKTFVITYFEDPGYDASYDRPMICDIDAESYSKATEAFNDRKIGYIWSIDEKAN